jgi:AAA domain (dynein-related subfamily)
MDGLEKLSRETLATLQGFLTDRHVTMPNGTKFVQAEKTSTTLDASSTYCLHLIHPSFRVIALASAAAFGTRSAPPTWLSEEVISSRHHHGNI